MKLSHDASFAMMANLIYLVTRLVLPPLILAHISLAEYGLWAACFILLGYIGLADFGFSATYLNSAAKMHAAHDTAGIGALLSTGIGCMLVICTFLLTSVLIALPSLLATLHIAPALQQQARIVISACLLIFLFDMCGNAFAYVLHGIGHFRDEKKVWLGSFLLEILAIAALLLAGFGIYALLLAFALRYVLALACNIGRLYQLLPGLRVGPRYFTKALIPPFLQRGMKLQASNFFAMALHSADRTLAAIFLGPQALALFELGSKLPVSAASIPAAISQATQPKAAQLAVENQTTQLQSLYQQSTRACAMVAALPLAFLALFAPLVCQLWLGQKFSHSGELALLPLLMSLAALLAWIHISTGPGTAVFRAMGNQHNEFVYHFLRSAGIAMPLLVLTLRQQLTVTNLALSLCISGALAALLYLFNNHRLMGLSWRALVAEILLPASAPFALASVLQMAFAYYSQSNVLNGAGRLTLFFAFIVLGLLYVIACALVFRQLLQQHERSMLADYCAKLPAGALLANWLKPALHVPQPAQISLQTRGGQREH